MCVGTFCSVVWFGVFCLCLGGGVFLKEVGREWTISLFFSICPGDHHQMLCHLASPQTTGIYEHYYHIFHTFLFSVMSPTFPMTTYICISLVLAQFQTNTKL